MQGETYRFGLWYVMWGLRANSLLFGPGFGQLALDGLGKFTKLGASILIMGLCGNAILPSDMMVYFGAD